VGQAHIVDQTLQRELEIARNLVRRAEEEVRDVEDVRQEEVSEQVADGCHQCRYRATVGAPLRSPPLNLCIR
jgi:hypothetical protein